MSECPHNALRKSKERYAENMYVCGNCSALFEVKEHKEPEPPKEKPPMFDRRPPWGTRPRQA
jgi:hypothetical protein